MHRFYSSISIQINYVLKHTENVDNICANKRNEKTMYFL